MLFSLGLKEFLMSSNAIVGIIPARWASTRFPGKPLVDILGKSLIQRTYEQAKGSSLIDCLAVATDDQRIASHVEAFGGVALMTSEECLTGTDRVHEAIQEYFPKAEIVVNIQGDEPCLDPAVVDAIIGRLQNTPEAVLSTPVTPITHPEDLSNPAVVKCVFDYHGKALYFSRSPIPFSRKEGTFHEIFRHVGLYCFRRAFLSQYACLPPSRLQRLEDLEQLKVLEAGYPIHVCVVKEFGMEVNTPEDIKKVETFLCHQENTFSSQAALSLL